MNITNKNNWSGKHGPLLIAEIGGNHEGNLDYAVELTKLAIESDVDYVKFQIYDGNSLVNKLVSPDRYKHFNKFMLTVKEYKILAKLCKESNIGFMASIWSNDLIDEFDSYIPIYKIGSGDLTAYSVIKKIVSKNKPIILSTGISTFSEVNNSVNYIKTLNNSFYNNSNNLAILQCTSMYPIQYEDANINVIKSLKKINNVTVGYSDHTTDNRALIYSYILGAEILEFHFTDTKKGKVFRDHKVSLTKKDVSSLINEIKIIKRIKGSHEKKPENCEIKNDHHISFRRGVYLNKNIKKGEIIKETDLISLRPNVGISAENYFQIIGKESKKDIKSLEPLSFKFFK